MREMFFFKNHAENKAKDQFQTSLFFEKALYELKASDICTRVSIYFDRPLFGHTIKTNRIKLRTIDPEICSI